MVELVLNGGVTHMKLMIENVVANRNRLSGIKRYNREDVEKWLADYDVSAPRHRRSRISARDRR
jgi:hypothetical protein